MNNKIVLNKDYFDKRRDQVAVMAVCENISMEEFHNFREVYTMCIDYIDRSDKTSLYSEDLENIIEILPYSDSFRRNYFKGLLTKLNKNLQ